jgi:ATP-dependent exoDNAse (exonuclease V) alpha subunit
MLTARGEVATEETLDRERRMVAMIDKGVNKFKPLGRGRAFVPSSRLRAEQKEALRAVLASRDLAFNLSGSAGVGKTTLLQEVHRELTAARRSVIAVAPTAKAVEELREVGFQNAVTIARLLNDPQQQHELAGQVLIVDEAGMVSTRDMTELIGLAKTAGARIVFSGDTAQIKSVEAGDALRVLERESQMQSFALREVVRQTNAEYREAVETIRIHPAEGFAKFEAMGAIREVDWREKPGEVARIYREEAALPNREGKKRSVLIEASTHDEIKSITHAIRQDRQRAGEIDRGETLQRHEALNWTEAQKKRCQQYRPGMLLEFHKAVNGVEKNETLEVVSARKTGIVAARASGETVTLTAKQAKAFGVFERQDIEVSAGDRILLQANRREKGFRATNGELVTVASVEAGAIQLEDGRALPADYRQFTHGYAVTAHRSQGGKADFTIVMGDRMARDTFYVAVTRGQEGLAIVTSDSQGLQESIGVSADRQSAIELARQAAPAADRRKPDDFHAYEARHPEVKQRVHHQQKSELKEGEKEEYAHTHAVGVGI